MRCRSVLQKTTLSALQRSSFLPQLDEIRGRASSALSMTTLQRAATTLSSLPQQPLVGLLLTSLATSCLLKVVSTRLSSKQQRVLQQNDALMSFLMSFLLHNLLHSNDSMRAAVIENLSWQYLLPLSLTASIICSEVTPKSNKQGQVLSMTIAFFAGSIGSVLGGLFYSLLAVTAMFPNPQEAAVSVRSSCSLIASYIGGTLNFYETAQTLMTSIASSATLAAFQQTLRLISAMDVLVMIVYFSFLNHRHSQHNHRDLMHQADPILMTQSAQDTIGKADLMTKVKGYSVITLLSLGMIESSRLFTSICSKRIGNIPGMSTIFLCLLASVAALTKDKFRTMKEKFDQHNLSKFGKGKQ